MTRSIAAESGLFYLDEGSGPPLLFVPGLGATHEMFKPQVEAFRGSHRLILPDLRGTGRSGRLSGPVGTVLDRQADDLASVLDRAGVDSTATVGVSYGGALALHFARRHPDRTSGLVVVDSFAELKLRRPMEALILVGSYLTLWAFYLPRPAMKAALRAFYRRWPTALEVIPALVDGYRSTEAALQSLAMCGVGPASTFGSIRRPTLGIVGDRSGTAVAMMRRAMAAIPGSRLEVVRDSFDPTNLCRPGEFNRLLAGFLREVGW